MPVSYIRVMSQFNCGDVTILNQKRLSLATMAKSAIDNCFSRIVCSGHQIACKKWNNIFVTVNNDFGVTREAICQWFSLETSSLVKIIGKSPHSWPKMVIHGNSCIILYISPSCNVYASVNWISIRSDIGLSPIRHQAIISTNARTLLIGPLRINFSEILIKIQKFSFTKMHLKISSVKWRPSCSGGDELAHCLWRCQNTGRFSALRWRHNGRDIVSNHQPHHCLLNRLFRRRSKKISKLRVTGLCAGNSPGTSKFPAQMASNAENFSILWRHHGITNCEGYISLLGSPDKAPIACHFHDFFAIFFQ